MLSSPPIQIPLSLLLRPSMTLLRSSMSLSLVVLPVSSSNPPIPARDRTITFGKHKGRMLGSLPSKYLTWVSKNLRARDFREWAELADQVLADEVYRDRLEWESAERILTGNDINTTSSSSPVSDLLQISHRFGWDNRDKAAWARVDFALLGTSKGGRIPRIGTQQPRSLVVDDDDDEYSSKKKNMVGVGGKREERRERRRARNMGKEVDNASVGSGSGSVSVSGSGKWVNPFPGRGALLDKIKRAKEEEEEGVVNW